jgi:DNA-binding PadR family transcriptional regulator
MSSRNLTPVSYVVLGLVARDGPSTPYDLKAAVGRGIAYFWPFPHSQIYSETEYLAGLGLLAHEQERRGRRRRTFRLTDAGRLALQAWLREPTSDPVHVRSHGFLQLYFGAFGRPEDMLNLANVQIATFKAQVHEVGEMVGRLQVGADGKWQLAVAEMFGEMSRAILDSWTRVAARASRELRSPPARPPHRGSRASAAAARTSRRHTGA